MSDGVQLNAGAGGDIAAADDIGGFKYQIVKAAWGADGAVNHTSAAAPMPINVTTLPTLTKGTQGSTGLSVQNLSDAGRNVTNIFMALPIVTTNAEVMQSMVAYKGGIEVVATTTPAVVTAGKTYRINSITITHIGIATAGSVLVRLRANLSGVAVIGSPLVCSWVVGSLAGVGVIETVTIPFPDGMEFAAGTGLAVGFKGLSPTATDLAAGYASIAINGFEF